MIADLSGRATTLFLAVIKRFRKKDMVMPAITLGGHNEEKVGEFKGLSESETVDVCQKLFCASLNYGFPIWGYNKARDFCDHRVGLLFGPPLGLPTVSGDRLCAKRALIRLSTCQKTVT